ncbi:MAG: hypothetical protein IJE09_05945 [Oscillospiraceae bacterium]|nr:hypothetical protein [Oscillospiraceae bacterium]
MGLLDKINRWRGFYDESIEPCQEFAAFPIKFTCFEDFADPFARSMSMEIFKAMGKEKEIENGVPYVLWGDRPAADEYVYILRCETLTDELLESFEEAQQAFLESVTDEYKRSLITLVCVENGSSAFERYCERKPRMEGFELQELVVGINFAEQTMHTGILSNCVGEKNAAVLRKEFLRMIRAAENCFNG